MKISTVQEMRAMDRYAIDHLGIPEAILMENAGLAVSFVLDKEVGIRNKMFAVFCSVGNNGGDGFVVARQIMSKGGRVKVFIIGDEAKFKGAANENLDILKRLSADMVSVSSIQSMVHDIRHADGIIDAIFGTGLDREVSGLQRDVILQINKSGKPVLSIDIPSGIHGDSGQIMGAAVQACCTVALGLPKIGNMLYPGYERCGRLYVSHISFPPDLYEKSTLKIQTNDRIDLPPRERTAHKGSVGDALFIAGSAQYIGAPYFAAYAFLKAGGGYARLATPRSIAPCIGQKASELVMIPLVETDAGSIAGSNMDRLLAMADKATMVVVGPGISLDPETQQLVRDLARLIQRPLLIDGDGLTAVAADLGILRDRKAPTILTPHPGEMLRIVNRSKAELEYDRMRLLQETSRDLGATIVLKGAHSLVGCEDESVFVNLNGNAGMATAGSGDVLAGTIAAMAGLGLPPAAAARKGVFIHGLAGDLAAEAKGEDGMTAEDILRYLPPAMKMDRKDAGTGGHPGMIALNPADRFYSLLSAT
jgi:ADP-dependent NAD(P)H-hydrate dehydratase / NAD(P)H-hydrate epimerase